MKILVAADGSGYARRAVQYVIRRLTKPGFVPEIHLINVQPHLPGRATAAVSASVVRDYYREMSGKALAPAARQLRRAKLPFRASYMVGEPGRVIAKEAQRGKYDLVVMGSRGHGALAGLVLGSVVSKVLASCSVPVLIIR